MCASVHFIGQTSNLSRCDLHTDPHDIVPDTLHFVITHFTLWYRLAERKRY